jgi:hypothetical protein
MNQGSEQTQLRYTPMYAGPVRAPPDSFQLRVRKETNTRDTVNARYIESWNTNIPIQQSRPVKPTVTSVANFNRFADAYRVPTMEDGDAILAKIPDYTVPIEGPNPNVDYEKTTTYSYIEAFTKVINAYDTKNNLYTVGALGDVFENQTDRKNFLNMAIEKEKHAISTLLGATYMDPTFSGKPAADKIRILKNATIEAFTVQRNKNVNEIAQMMHGKNDSADPPSLDTVYQDMAPQISRQDTRDFRQSKPYDSSGPNLAMNPFFDRYDPTRDPRNMVREVRSVVYEPKEPDSGLNESERIRARTFTNRNISESETPVALTQWYDLMRPKIDNPEIVYRNQNTIWKLGSELR